MAPMVAGMVQRLVVIGGDAGGMAAISAARAVQPDLEVIALERGRHTSYSACGIPYHVGGDVERLSQLVARSPEQHRANGIDVRLGSEAVVIYPAAREVHVEADGGRYTLAYDQLL